MALSGNTVWEVQTGGSDNNGGGYVSGGGGTDYSQATTAHATLTAASVVNGTTTIIDVSAGDYTCAAGDVGNFLQITGGTAVAGWYQIVSRSGQQWTMDRVVGSAGQTCVGAMGGALASPGKNGAVVISGNIVFIKAGTYSITSASANVSNGCLNSTSSVAWVGYSTTRTISNTDTKPVLQLNVASATLVTMGFMAGIFINIDCDGNSQTSSKLAQAGNFYRCKIHGFNSASVSTIRAVFCEITANSASIFGTAGASGSNAFACEIYANTTTQCQSGYWNDCLIYGNTGGSTDGIDLTGGGVAENCIMYNNGRSGGRQSSAVPQASAHWINCHAEANAAYGFNFSGAAAGTITFNCSTYGNASGGVNAPSLNPSLIGAIALSGSAFVNAASGNFALNNTAGAGASLRAAGLPALFSLGLTASYPDIGAAQHQDTGGGGGGGGLLVNPGLWGGMS